MSTTDSGRFAQLWRELAPHRHAPEAPAKWDERITQMPGHYGPDAYSQRFLELAGLEPGESVFDMGCGAGTLAIPCALRGSRVTAADFSTGMLAQLEANAHAWNVPEKMIAPVRLSWTDDWHAAGIKAKSHDVAFASRSIITDDLADSLARLNAVARRKVCVTAVPGTSPRCFPALLKDIDLTPYGHQDASFVFAIASELGFLPEVAYLRSARVDSFPTAEAAFAKYAPMLDLTLERPEGATRQKAELRLRDWLDAHLVPDADGPEAHLTPDVPRIVTWAFISWEAI